MPVRILMVQNLGVVVVRDCMRLANNQLKISVICRNNDVQEFFLGNWWGRFDGCRAKAERQA